MTKLVAQFENDEGEEVLIVEQEATYEVRVGDKVPQSGLDANACIRYLAFVAQAYAYKIRKAKK